MKRYYDKSMTPLKWHWFTSRFRTPFGCLMEIVTFFINIYLLETNYPSSNGLLLIDCLVSLLRSVVLAFAIYGLVKFMKKGVKLYFIDLVIQLLYFIYALIIASSYELAKSYENALYGIPAVTISIVLEGIYYYKRYPLFSDDHDDDDTYAIDSEQELSRKPIENDQASERIANKNIGLTATVEGKGADERCEGRKFCRYCGNKIDVDAAFCRYCGADLSDKKGYSFEDGKSFAVNSDNKSDAATELRKYKLLLDEGLITAEDYEMKKKQILSKY